MQQQRLFCQTYIHCRLKLLFAETTCHRNYQLTAVSECSTVCFSLHHNRFLFNTCILSTHADRQGVDISFIVRFVCVFCLYSYGFLWRG